MQILSAFSLQKLFLKVSCQSQQRFVLSQYIFQGSYLSLWEDSTFKCKSVLLQDNTGKDNSPKMVNTN